MKNAINLSVLVWANKARKSPEGLLPLYARITYLGKRAEISLNLKVDPKRWNANMGLMKDNSSESKKLNAEIGSIRKELEKVYDILTHSGTFVSAEAIKSKYLGEEKSQRKLLEVFTEHNQKLKELIGKGVVKGTHTKYETIRSKVTAFIKDKYKVNDLYLDALQYSFITNFEHYLKAEQNISHNVVMSYIKRVKRIVRIAFQNKWINHNPFDGFVCTTKKTVRTELEANELITIEEKVFETDRLKEVADCYLFSCYTGYAFVDASKLSSKNIVKGTDGELWIKTDRTKSKIEANVPLIPKALSIIEKYKNHPSCVFHNRLLPMRSNQKMNEYLKEIAGVCGINKNLTTHTARHTFATTVTLENGVPMESVSKMLGHTKITTTQIYSRVKEKKVSADMKILRAKVDSTNPVKNALAYNSQIPSNEFIKIALSDTKYQIAPIIREFKKFEGTMIMLSWISYQKYLEYRRAFKSYDHFVENGNVANLLLYIIGDESIDTELEVLLNNSIYFLEKNAAVKLSHRIIDDGFEEWITI